MRRLLQFPPLLALTLLLFSCFVSGEDSRPQIEFATTPERAQYEPPALVKAQYNQFAPPPGHHRHHHHDGGVSRKNLLHWMERLGLHPSKSQVEKLYGLVNGHRRHRHHHGEEKAGGEGNKHHVDGGSEEKQKEAWTEVESGDKESGDGQTKPAPKVGVLPPASSKPRGWGDENPSPPSAAKPPLPEPANTLPSPTGTSSNRSSILPPIPAGGVAKNVTVAPATSTPAISEGTSGSYNPSSTTAQGNKVPDDRLGGMTGEGSGRSVAGVPVSDDGDLKVPGVVNGTEGGTVKSASERRGEGWGWMGTAGLAGVVLFVVLFVAV